MKANIKNKYPENDVDEILPKLFLGNSISSYNDNFLAKYKIRYIIRVMYEFDFSKKKDDIIYYHIEIKDSKYCPHQKQNAVGFDPNFYQRLFDDVTRLIDELRKIIELSDDAILIHCKRGHHRSASIIVAYLVKYKNFKYAEAINYIKNIRPNSLKKNSCIMNELYKYCLLYQ